MPTNLESALAGLAERLVFLATNDAELRNALRRLAQAFLESTEAQANEPAAESEPAATAINLAEQVEVTIQSLEAAIHAEALPTGEDTPIPVRLPELTLGRAVRTEPSAPTYSVPAAAWDFGLVETRCRLKAEGARWAATRQRLIAEGASFLTEIEPKDREIVGRAKELPNCFLWMCHSSGPAPSNLALFEEVAGCFDAVAEGVGLVRQIQEEPDVDQTEFEAALDLLAEAQSALRVAIDTIDGAPDSDQSAVFHWLRAKANETQIFIRHFMRLDDPADAAGSSQLISRMEQVEARVQEARRRRSHRKKLLGKVRHKTMLILNDPVGAASEWKLLASTVCELIAGGLPPSNRELREFLIPVIDLLPEQDELPHDFELVLREIDRYMATCAPPELPVSPKLSPEVAETARLLQGRSLVMIGGDKRPGPYQALKEAFGLRDLIWIETRSHESIAGFEPYVARPDVAAILLAIRWSSHSYGEVKAFCETHGKPLVRLPGGYNPNQVAAQIVSQCSDRLRGSGNVSPGVATP